VDETPPTGPPGDCLGALVVGFGCALSAQPVALSDLAGDPTVRQAYASSPDPASRCIGLPNGSMLSSGEVSWTLDEQSQEELDSTDKSTFHDLL